MGVGRLLVRGAVGALFVGHGTQKLFGWFGGGGPEETGKSFEGLGLAPGRRNAIAAGTAEATGGVLLAAGLATPVASALLTSVMLTAIRKLHWANGPWATNGGYEYNLVLIAAVLALAEDGPGPLSLDAALGRERRGAAWALFALASGVAGSLAATTVAGRTVPEEATPREQAAPAAVAEPS